LHAAASSVSAIETPLRNHKYGYANIAVKTAVIFEQFDAGFVMDKIDQYLQAATRENTRRSYASAVRHFEVEWGGFLPATADSMARYLVDYAEKLSINTLKQRIAALAQWLDEAALCARVREDNAPACHLPHGLSNNSYSSHLHAVEYTRRNNIAMGGYSQRK